MHTILKKQKEDIFEAEIEKEDIGGSNERSVLTAKENHPQEESIILSKANRARGCDSANGEKEKVVEEEKKSFIPSFTRPNEKSNSAKGQSLWVSSSVERQFHYQWQSGAYEKCFHYQVQSYNYQAARPYFAKIHNSFMPFIVFYCITLRFS